MTAVYPLIQMLSHLTVLTPVFTPWQTCAQKLIDRNQPSSVFFNCKRQLCPDNDFYKSLQVPSQTVFGLESSDLPTFKETDLVFLVDDRLVPWKNDTVQKYRRNGGSDFSVVMVANMNGNFDDLSNAMKDLFSAMWLSGIVRCAVLLVNDISSRIYTYHPFKDRQSCEDTTPVLLGECTEIIDTVFDLTHKIINLNQCPLRMAVLDDRPFLYFEEFSHRRFGKLVTEIASRMNASVETIQPASGGTGGTCESEESSGLKGMVLTGKAHMAVGSFNQQECSTLEYVSLAYTQCLTWCTPLLSTMNDHIFLFIVKPLQTKVWIALILSAVIVSVIVLLLCSATSERWTSRDAFHLALVIYAQPPPVEPRTSPVRLIVIIWLLACLVIRSAHEGALKSQSSLRMNFRVIRNVIELLDTDLQLCSSSSNLQSLSLVKHHPFIQKVLERVKHCTGGLFDNMIAAATLRDRAVFTSDLRCIVVASQLWPQSLYLYPQTKPCFKTFQVSTIITLPGSPFKHRWRTIQDRCTQAGLILKWLDVEFLHNPPVEARPYTIRHVLPALFALGVGCLVALLSFVCEKIFH